MILPGFRLPLVLIVSAASLMYGNIYSVPFSFDGKEVIKDALAFKEFFANFSPAAVLRPRAVVDASFAFNYRLGHLNVFGYQLFNVAVHAMNGVLVYFLSLLIFSRFPCKFSSPAVSFFAALVFVSHPVQTQAVTYAIQRYTSVAALFYMASVFFYLRARIASRGGRGPRVSSLYLTSVFCGIAAFLSKQNAAALPIAIVLAEFFIVERTVAVWKNKIPWIVLFFGLWFCFIYSVLWMGTEGGAGKGWVEDVSSRMSEMEGAGRWSYLCTQFNVVAIYIKLLFFPFQQNMDYMYPFKRGFWDGNTPVAFLFLSGVAGWAIASMKKFPIAAFGVFWFFAALAVESSVIPIRDPLFEHRLYLPMAGFALILSGQLFGLPARTRQLGLVMAAAIIFLFGVGTHLRNEVWTDPVKLWSDSVMKNPKNFRGRNNLGELLMSQNRLPEALEHFSIAAKIVPVFPEVHYNIGLIHGEMGRLREALGELKIAKRLGMRSFELHYRLGFYCGNMGLWDQAAEEYLLALKLKPDSSEVHNDLCVAYFRMGRYPDAARVCEKAAILDPTSFSAYGNLGNVYLSLKRYPEAAKEYQTALRLKPDLHESRYNLGIAYFHQGLLKEAEREWTSVLDSDPGHEHASRALNMLKGAGTE